MSGSKRISELTVTTTLTGNDRVVVLTNPASSAQTQTTTLTSLTNNLRLANTTATGVVKVGNNLSVNASGFLNSNTNVGNFVFTTNSGQIVLTTNTANTLNIVGNNAAVNMSSNDYVQMVFSQNSAISGGGNTQTYVWVESGFIGQEVIDTVNNRSAEKYLYANGLNQFIGSINSYSYGWSISPNDGYGVQIQPHDSYNNILTILPTGDHDIHLFESGTGGAVTLGDYGQSHISVYGPGGNDTFGNNANEILIHLIDNTALTIVTNDTNYEWKFAANGVLTLPNTSGNIYRNGVSVINAGIKWTKLIDTTTPYTVAANDEVIICDPNAAGGDITINFPNTNTEGKLFTVKNINNGSHNCYVKIADLSSKLEIPGTGTLNSNNNLNASGKFATWIYSSGAYRCIGSGS